MTKIILSGCNGKMGKVITQCVAQRGDCEIVAGFDLNTECTGGFPVYSVAADCTQQADVIIDFSHPSALTGLLDYAEKHRLPAVVATTGLEAKQVDQLKKAAEQIPIFFSANMSLGISLLTELAKKAARVLGASFDIEIVEMHHNQKLDAPSGTALMLADAISEELEQPPRYEFDRHSKRAKREKNEIGIHAVRGGTVTGEHTIVFAGHDEVVKLSHSAMSKEIFASGSINAALFLARQTPGLYAMKDLVAAE